jgi:Major Facilitator Superfamily.
MTLWIIMGIVLLNSIGFSVVLPLLPFLVGRYLTSQQIVVGMSALMSVFAACSFVAAPIFGALSDRYGRKKILMLYIGHCPSSGLRPQWIFWKMLFNGRNQHILSQR